MNSKNRKKKAHKEKVKAKKKQNESTTKQVSSGDRTILGGVV
jgi:hypothetical protein